MFTLPGMIAVVPAYRKIVDAVEQHRSGRTGTPGNSFGEHRVEAKRKAFLAVGLGVVVWLRAMSSA